MGYTSMYEVFPGTPCCWTADSDVCLPGAQSEDYRSLSVMRATIRVRPNEAVVEEYPLSSCCHAAMPVRVVPCSRVVPLVLLEVQYLKSSRVEST